MTRLVDVEWIERYVSLLCIHADSCEDYCGSNNSMKKNSRELTTQKLHPPYVDSDLIACHMLRSVSAFRTETQLSLLRWMLY